ncbi:MAG: hypothetical protein MK096_14250 [Oleiphilaceae bacterium]|nr:hypothetical protein [Oleiphilaceae bacterium]
MKIHSETVLARDGKLEDKIVFGFSLLTLLTAAALLYALYGHQHSDFTAIPKPIRAALTSLSNAGEEIQIIREIEEYIPSIDSLSELGIAPFTPSALSTQIQFSWEQVSSCYVGTSVIGTKQYFVKLELPDLIDQPAKAYWFADAENQKSRAELKQLCIDSTITWHSAATFDNINTKTHAH